MILLNASVSRRKLPVNFKADDLHLFAKELEKQIPATHLLKLRNVRVNADSLIFKNAVILPESFVDSVPSGRYKRLGNWAKFLLENYLKREKIEIVGDCIWFINNWSYSYFHWMTDAIPRLFSVKDLIPNSTVLLPSSFAGAEYIKSALRPFRVSDLFFIPKNKVLLLRSLILPTQTALTGNYNDGIMRQLREFYTEFYSNKAGLSLGDKIYVSRSKASKRKVINEEEVAGLLKRYGFKIVNFEDFSFDEQVNIALTAKYLMSNHGAGLTNMLFMSSGNCVFELRREGDTHNNCYFSLASALGLKYFYQTCKAENNNGDTYRANLIVDLKILRRNIEFMLDTIR